MTAGADIVYIVHGSNAHTWWRRLANHGYPWWRRWSMFCWEVRRSFGRDCEIREFRWSGRNTHQARMVAASSLASAIESAPAAARIHVIGHSHGGNVALGAADLLPASRVETLVLLANPNMALLDRHGVPPQWLYWGRATERVGLIWNLYSPQDWIQCQLVRLFHGMHPARRRSVLVRRTYGGSGYKAVRNGAIHWAGKLAAHRAMHSAAMGTVVGGLLRTRTFQEAMNDAGLALERHNVVRDRGGWPGIAKTQEMIRYLGDPRPFDLGSTSGNAGILFIHGFTASPAETRPMAEFMAQQAGWRCRGILLPGHGTSVEDMQTAGGEDWIAAAERALEDLSQRCRHVFIAGVSLGAVICCHVAFRRKSDSRLRGVILLAPAFGVSRKQAVGLRLLRPFRNLRSKGTRATDYFLDHKLCSYVQNPLDKAADVLRLGQEAWENLGKLKGLPVLMFAGDLESSVSLEKIHTAAQRNPWIQFVRLPRSRHILTVEPDRETLFEASAQFVKECLGKPRSGGSFLAPGG